MSTTQSGTNLPVKRFDSFTDVLQSLNISSFQSFKQFVQSFLL